MLKYVTQDPSTAQAMVATTKMGKVAHIMVEATKIKKRPTITAAIKNSHQYKSGESSQNLALTFVVQLNHFRSLI